MYSKEHVSMLIRILILCQAGRERVDYGKRLVRK
jgi:hypothetical protein